MDFSTPMSCAKKPMTSQNSQAEQGDGLFDEFIDSDSFESSDNGAADRANGDDWSILFDFAPPYNQISTPDSLKCNFREQRLPFAEVDKSLAVPNDADRIVSLVDFDAIKYPTPPHSTSSLSSRKSGRVHDRSALSASKPKSTAVSKSKKIPPPLKMSHQGGSRRTSSSEKRGSTSGSSTTSGRGQQARPSQGQPPISMAQPQWSSINPHQGYEESYTTAAQPTNLPAYREPYTSQSPLHLSRTTSAQLSPVASPGYEHYGGGGGSHDEQSSYFHSPDTPYVTEADAPLGSEYPTFSHYPSEASFHFESPAHESSMGIPYTRGGEYADSQVRPWWHSASGTQPYTTTYPTEEYGPHPHVSPLYSLSQSEPTTDIGGLMIKRHTELRQPNYSNIGYEHQQQRQPYLESHELPSANISPGDRGRGRPHPTLRSTPQLMEAVLPSSMPSPGAQGVRKTSSSRSSQSGPSGGGGAASSSKQSKRKPGGSSRRDPPTETGFVNYTPDDSKKLLTGVAPSGSSKTKARREKEAADKRKRINRATAKAVREAGGGLEEVFKREGFILEEEDSEEEEGSPSGA